jgi:F420-dependent oxidoreductase-like protein
MKVGTPLAYAGGFMEAADEIVAYEQVGLDIVFVAEPYSFDAVSQLGFLAARTSAVRLASGILNIYSRTPSLLAMTAAGLDHVSGGRFVLGIGASGPQVIEGFHGLRYDAPLGRTREVVEICRQVWRREALDHHGRHYDIPLTPERGGSGLGKPLKIINCPLRPAVPVVLAALGPKNVELAAEVCDGWEPIFFLPEAARDAFGDALDAGAAKRPGALGPLEVIADSKVFVSTDEDEIAAADWDVRQHLALYIGGMGSREKNFYNDLAIRYGFPKEAATVQDHFLQGRKDEAARALPAELVRGVSVIGTPDEVAARVDAFRNAGVSTLNVAPLATTHHRRLQDIALVAKLAAE